MQTLTVRPGRVRKLLIAGVAALFALALLVPVLVQAQTTGAPSVPRNVQVAQHDSTPTDDSDNGTELKVTWAAPSSEGAGPITKYQVDWYDAATTPTGDEPGTTVADVLVTAARERVIQTLMQGDPYWVRVRAVNASGEGGAEVFGPWSAPVSAVPHTAPTAAPVGLTVASSDSKLEVSWTAPADGGSPITHYIVRYREAEGAGAGTWHNWPHTSAAVKTEITGLENGTAYHVQVQAVNAAGAGDWATTDTAKTPAGVPAAPTITKIEAARTSDTDHTLTITWKAPTNNGSAVTHYELQYRSITDGDWLDHALPGSGESGATDTMAVLSLMGSADAPVASKLYHVRVRAVNGALVSLTGKDADNGIGPWSESMSGTTEANPVVAFHLHDGSCHAAPTNHHPGVEHPAGATECSRAPAKPSAPVIESQDGALGVSWIAPSNNGSKIIDYDVQYRKSGSSSWMDVAHDGTDLTVTLSDLTNGQSYDVRVRAENKPGTATEMEGGEGPWSDHASGTPNLPPPPEPTPTPVVIEKTVEVPGPTRTVTRTETRTVYRDRPAPAPAPVPTIIGDSGFATTYLAVDGQSIELRIHPQAGGPASHTFALGAFLRDADLGQTYQIVAGGKRRWIAPTSPLVYQVPWVQVNSMYTFASNVVAAIPLDESNPPQGFLVRGMNGRIVSYDVGMWRWVPNIPTFQALGYRWCDVNNADAGFFSRISEGTPHPVTSQPENPNYPVCG